MPGGSSVPFTTGSTNRTASVFAKSNNSGSLAYADDFLLRRHATVNNGQLENAESDVWNSVYGGAIVSGDSTYDGEYAWKIPASGSSAGVEQDIVGLTPSTAYRLSGWTTNGNAGLTFGVKNHGATQVTSTNAVYGTVGQQLIYEITGTFSPTTFGVTGPMCLKRITPCLSIT